MRYTKQEFEDLTIEIVNQSIEQHNGIRCVKNDFIKILEFIDSHNDYQFIAKSSHKEEFDFYVTFGRVNKVTVQEG